MGLSVTPFCDRCSVVVSTSQLRFIDMFLKPLLAHVKWAAGTQMHESLKEGLALTVAHWTEHEVMVTARAAHPHRATLRHLDSFVSLSA